MSQFLSSGELCGVVLRHEKVEIGEYRIKQSEQEIELPNPVGAKTHEYLDFLATIGPVKIAGCVNTAILEYGLRVSVLGIKLGNFYGSSKCGINIDINLLEVKGTLRFGSGGLVEKELWVEGHIEMSWGKTFNGREKLISWMDFLSPS